MIYYLTSCLKDTSPVGNFVGADCSSDRSHAGNISVIVFSVREVKFQFVSLRSI